MVPPSLDINGLQRESPIDFQVNAASCEMLLVTSERF